MSCLLTHLSLQDPNLHIFAVVAHLGKTLSLLRAVALLPQIVGMQVQRR